MSATAYTVHRWRRARPNHRIQVGRLGLIGALWLLGLGSSQAACFDAAGMRYSVSPALLRAVAQQESGMNPLAINRNRNGSTDIGLMQINSSWLPLLERHGLRQQDLWEPCTNVMVGAWILGGNFKRMGVTVAALGAYNTSDPQRRERYARQVLSRLPTTRQP
ncbi:lytic transglycosylase domain-containing protein [Roseateles amylovorans]|uniref:Lytic transglycosylase domain-containing protein n=1 Tax=Roseateles amylovorans TaxID=2978473 RepID=A0ABY6B8L4_9BURK|nr:lytic transglycosylase domain-containing protein [Roseateles amylovorans]UXH80271.1 lytic transglycosylase domain-containing protein [Roseateles amylovorans]